MVDVRMLMRLQMPLNDWPAMPISREGWRAKPYPPVKSWRDYGKEVAARLAEAAMMLPRPFELARKV